MNYLHIDVIKKKKTRKTPLKMHLSTKNKTRNNNNRGNSEIADESFCQFFF